MKEIPNKSVGSPYSPEEFNFGIKNSLQNIVANVYNGQFDENNEQQNMGAIMRCIEGNIYRAVLDSNVYNTTAINSISNYSSQGYFTGQIIRIRPNTTNTSNVSINLNNIGAIPVVDELGNLLVSGEIRANKLTSLLYDGTNFVLYRPQSDPIIQAKFNLLGVIQGIPTGITQDNIDNPLSVGGGSAAYVKITFPFQRPNANYIINLQMIESTPTNVNFCVGQNSAVPDENVKTNDNQSPGIPITSPSINDFFIVPYPTIYNNLNGLPPNFADRFDGMPSGGFYLTVYDNN